MSNDIEQSPQESQPACDKISSPLTLPPPKQKPKYYWLVVGCGCIFWSAFACMGFLVVMTFLAFLFPNLFVSDGEHLPTAEFAPGSTNYSFSETYMRRWREFDIPEAAFLEACQKQHWTPVPIETLPELPPIDGEHRDWSKDRINYKRECPLQIGRYCSRTQPKHRDCDAHYGKCKIDPTGLTDDSCFRIVSKGYYFEHRISNGGGIYILYDSSNGRFYSVWNRR